MSIAAGKLYGPIMHASWILLVFRSSSVVKDIPIRQAVVHQIHLTQARKGKVTPCLITERRVPELIPVLGSQPAGDESHKPGGKLTLLSARPAVTIATLNRAATNFAAW